MIFQVWFEVSVTTSGTDYYASQAFIKTTQWSELLSQRQNTSKGLLYRSCWHDVKEFSLITCTIIHECGPVIHHLSSYKSDERSESYRQDMPQQTTAAFTLIRQLLFVHGSVLEMHCFTDSKKRYPDRIPQDKIPQDKISTDKIPQDRIPQDKIPQPEKWTKSHNIESWQGTAGWNNRFFQLLATSIRRSGRWSRTSKWRIGKLSR